MNSEVVVRRFEERDLDGAYDVIQRAFSTSLIKKVYEESAYEIWTSLYSKKYILGISKMRHLYVAEYNNRIVGTSAVSYDGSMAYISAVYVDPDLHGKGVGRKLMEAIDNDEISQSTKKLYLDAIITAKKFYEKMGYHSEGELPDIVIEFGIEFFLLFKEL